MRTKNLLFTINFIICCIVVNPTMGQEYFPFPENDAIWYSVNSWPDIAPPYVLYKTYRYETIGDTLIDGKMYTKLYSFLDTDFYGNYLGAYRVESDSQKVYFIDSYYNTESLIYDFSMVPGDSITINGTNYNPFTLTCYDTSSVELNGSIHKTYSIHSILTNGEECFTTWVEGIGSLRIPIETDIFCGSWFEGAYDLSCFFYQGEQIYSWLGNPFFTGCVGTNVSLNEHHLEDNIQIYPNPVEGVAKVFSRSKKSIIINCHLFNSLGDAVYSVESINRPEIQLDCSTLSSGLYLLVLDLENSRYPISKKIIIKTN